MKLEDCLMSNGDIVSALEHEGYLSARHIISAPQMKECKLIAEAQLEKVKPYIDELLLAEKKLRYEQVLLALKPEEEA